MPLKRLRTLAVVLPAAFLLATEVVRYTVLEPRMPREAVFVTMATVFVVGVMIFSAFVWRAVERIEGALREAYDEARDQSEQLAALHTAALTITGERDPDRVLSEVVEASRRVLRSRYGALTVVAPDGSIERFATSGLDDETVARIGPMPHGHGILGLVTETRQPLRLADMTRHPRFSGFPPHHPHMKTLLAVPMIYQDDHLGNLYVSEREDGLPFSARDQETLSRFAAQAAIAVANARLYDAAQRLSAMEERERIAMDLHDGVIQEIYAVGLALEAAADDVRPDHEEAARELDRAIDRLGHVTGDIRDYIMDLRGTAAARASFPDALRVLLDDVVADERIRTSLEVSGNLSDLPRDVRWELWHVAREALSNCVRHARAGRIDVAVARDGGSVRLRICDDGVGFDSDPGDVSHHGLRNMRRRMRNVGGTLAVESRPGGGTTVEAVVPAGPTLAREE